MSLLRTSAAPAKAAPAATATTDNARIATVVGTSRFGLSIRKLPGLNADRIATVPDGYQASVVDGPVSGDGAEWYKLQGPDVAGWASGTYLKVERGTFVPNPTSSSGQASASGSALASAGGPLSSLNKDSNYTVAGGGSIYVQPELKGATDHLSASPTGQGVLQQASKAYLRLTVAHLPSGSEGGEFSTLGHSLKIADSMMTESLDVQSTVLAHELTHAVDILVDHNTPDSAQACVNLELHAFQTQEKVWLEITKPVPPKTPIETELDQLSHVVNSPAFAQQLAKLYASECNVYTKA